LKKKKKRIYYVNVFLTTLPLKQSCFTRATKITSNLHQELLNVFITGIRLKKQNLILKALGGYSTRSSIRNLRNRIYHLYLNLVNRSFLILDILLIRFGNILPIFVPV